MRAVWLLLAVSCVQTPTPGTRTDAWRPQGVERVEVYLPRGDVDVVAGDDAWLRADVAWTGLEPHVSAAVTDGTLVVATDCADCRVDLHLRVPDAPIEVHTDAGLVVVEGFGTGVSAWTADGDVLLLGVSGHVDVTAAGDVDAIGLSDVGRVDVRTDAGQVRLEVPAGPYDLSLVTTSGTVEVRNVVPEPDAAAAISVTTDSGDVLVAGF